MNGGSHPSVRSFLRGHGARRVAFEDVAPFANVNTTTDLARIAMEVAL
jgi:molybdopterin-guanine dinucleotide biosynthesis protein A